ncbi:glycosyltransferase family 2 protein [Desulfovibrio sp. OttesenSCG-928-A18]|nr:glycosyltransferase family 2 protein [Desulfovibrio sp. OttesenSCG-928-A18]
MSESRAYTVVIPVYNNWELTENCLLSLRQHTPGSHYAVTVVDNGSTDETRSALGPVGEAVFPGRFTRIRFEENRNFGPACNAGAARASSPLLFFLNNDTVLTPGWEPPLLRAFEEEAELGAAGPLLLYEDNTVQHLGVVYSRNAVEHLYRHFPATHPAVKRRRHFQILTAAALMVPGALFAELGGFYEEYRNGFEDVDFCLHLHQRGRRLSCVPESVVLHLESRTPGRKRDDAHNECILRGRCLGLIKTDKHLLGQADGFLPFIDDSLDISLRLTAEDEAALNAAAHGKEAALWLKLVQEHPFWVQGRVTLAEALEREGHWSDALHLRGELAAILYSVDSWRDLLRCARKAGAEAAAEEALEILARLGAARKDRKLAEHCLRSAAASGDELLQRIYQEKFEQLYQQ